MIAAIFMAVYSSESRADDSIAMDNNDNPGCPYHPGQHGKYAGSA